MQSKLLHEQNVMSVLPSMSFKDHGNWMKQAKLLLIFSLPFKCVIREET